MHEINSKRRITLNKNDLAENPENRIIFMTILGVNETQPARNKIIK